MPFAEAIILNITTHNCQNNSKLYHSLQELYSAGYEAVLSLIQRKFQYKL